MRYLLASVLLLSSCKFHDAATTVASTKNTGTDTPAQDIATAVSDISGEYICLEKIKVNKMTIDFLGAGVQTTKFGHFMRLYYSADLCRDYLEIMRCNAAKLAELTCRDGKKLAMIDSTDEAQRQLNNPFDTTYNTEGLRDCWASIAENPSYGCVMLGGKKDSSGDRTGQIYGAEHFIDATAPAGQKFFYLARPCVHADRADELTSGNKNCSFELYVSNVVKDLEEPSIDPKIMEARQKVADIAAQLNYMTAKAYKITLEFSKALAQHETEDIKRQRSKNLRQGIAMITGLTVGAAGAIYTVGAGSIGSGLDAGQALGSAFADIIASKADYLTTCVKCMRLKAELKAVIGDVDGASFRGEGVEFIGMSSSLTRGSGHIYQQKLDQYEEALDHLNTLQKEKGDYRHHGKELAGSRGGPP